MDIYERLKCEKSYTMDDYNELGRAIEKDYTDEVTLAQLKKNYPELEYIWKESGEKLIAQTNSARNSSYLKRLNNLKIMYEIVSSKDSWINAFRESFDNEEILESFGIFISNDSGTKITEEEYSLYLEHIGGVLDKSELIEIIIKNHEEILRMKNAISNIKNIANKFE